MKKIEKIRIIPLGGLNEIGKNLTLIECGRDIVAIDCGMAFPDEDMPGVDYVIPDYQYIVKNADRFRAVLLTHGHEDHIGGIPYLLQQVKVPIYGTRLTLGIVKNKLKEFHLDKVAELHEVQPGDVVKLTNFSAEFIRVNHSIADATAIALHTPCGTLVHTGDFKIDVSPIQGTMIDLARFGELGKQGVLALMCESTNVERPGYAMSERNVGETFDQIFRSAVNKRIIIATFASNVDRVQQVIDCAIRYGRKVAVSGRSMLTVLEVALELGYMKIPDGVLIDIEKINKFPPEKIVIVTTGSQGEQMSALYRMAYSDHKMVEITPRDLIVISATAIPGNEKLVYRVVNELYKSGAEVVYEHGAAVHVSGHACQEELKLMIGLCKPKFFIPVHGEYRHLKKNAALAELMGVPAENIVISDIGNIIEVSKDKIENVGTVPAGKTFVDGLGVGDVGSIVLRDRRLLSQDGVVIVSVVLDYANGTLLSDPEVITRGFVYMKENEQLLKDVEHLAEATVDKCVHGGFDTWSHEIKAKLRDEIGKYIYEQTKRRPMILPVVSAV